jgi:hypothetical protein
VKPEESLTQEEIDRLLRGITYGGLPDPIEEIRSPKDLGNSLFKAIKAGTNLFGGFQGANLMLDRRTLRDAHLRAAVGEPESIARVGEVEIFPVNVCPHCGASIPDADVTAWFRESAPSPQFAQRHPGLSRVALERLWKREVETLPCPSCGKAFQPSTVVTLRDDGVALPAYCRYQTIARLQTWFDARVNKQVSLFSAASRTAVVTREGTWLYWDTFLHPAIRGLETCPGEIMANILRYTPSRDLTRLVARERGLAVFGRQDFTPLYRQEMAFKR